MVRTVVQEMMGMVATMVLLVVLVVDYTSCSSQVLDRVICLDKMVLVMLRVLRLLLLLRFLQLPIPPERSLVTILLARVNGIVLLLSHCSEHYSDLDESECEIDVTLC